MPQSKCRNIPGLNCSLTQWYIKQIVFISFPCTNSQCWPRKVLEVEGICETQTFKYFNLFLESYFPIYANRSYTWISTWNGISQLAFRFHALRLPRRYIFLVRAKLVSCSSCSTASSDCYTVRGWASVTMLSHLMSRESEKCLFSFHICLSLLKKKKKGCIFTLTLPSYV